MCLPWFKTPFPQKKNPNLQMTCEQCKKAPWLFRKILGDEKRPSHVGIIRNHSKDPCQTTSTMASMRGSQALMVENPPLF